MYGNQSVCGKSVTSRCIKKGHLILCKTHDTYYEPHTGCVKCKEAQDREEKADREAHMDAQINYHVKRRKKNHK